MSRRAHGGTSAPPRFGHTELPEAQRRALRLARRLEWVWLGTLLLVVAAMAAVVGGSQAMKTAWIEDMLSVLPPIAFLVGSRVALRRPTRQFPYGFHRSVGVGHLVAGVALAAVGVLLVVDSVTKFVKVEHPDIGVVDVFGRPVWLGWMMIAVMTLVSIPPIFFGRRKLQLAKTLHDKVLFADADMNKADWRTGLATVLGVIGIGLGLWWADGAAAVLVSISIISDGWKNIRIALGDLMDARVTTYDGSRVHPLVAQINRTAAAEDWVHAVASRVRDQGHVMHVEVFLHPLRMPGLAQLERLRGRCSSLDWRVQELSLVLCEKLPKDADPRLDDREEA